MEETWKFGFTFSIFVFVGKVSAQKENKNNRDENPSGFSKISIADEKLLER